MFSSVLIANRGEIASRIARTLRRLGIRVVAICSEADRYAPFVLEADEHRCVGGVEPSASYLNIDAIVAAAKETGAEAIHPGFGFLSENAAFAERLAHEGIAFIGPPAAAIAVMGDKLRAKEIAVKAGVSVIPGTDKAVSDPKAAAEAAAEIGFPLMIKAAAGGGGKGMRMVAEGNELSAALEASMREAQSSFGDGRVFLERFVSGPRHIEVQLLADTHGNAVHLFERECSVQRRHQKVIEEAPSPFVTDKMREAMCGQALALARAVDYCSAGTVEFMADAERNFYFLEMNTRLQVEHPVTEAITGIDLVEQMVRVAAGEKLSFVQKDIRAQGWALEARVYAEDPERGFLPSIGRLRCYTEPEGEGLRVDSGVVDGSEISIHYDPMLAKITATGDSREIAIDRLRRGLNGYSISGIRHNLDFLSAILNHPRFQAGKLSTLFIEEEYADGYDAARGPGADSPLALALIALLQFLDDSSLSGEVAGSARYHLFPEGADKGESEGNGTGLAVEITASDSENLYQLSLGDEIFSLHIDDDFACGLARVHSDDGEHVFRVERDGLLWRLAADGGRTSAVALPQHLASLWKWMPVKSPANHSQTLPSPMPGLLLKLLIKEGDVVETGQRMAIIEAMKMENVIHSPRAGTIAALHAAEGDSILAGQKLVEFAED